MSEIVFLLSADIDIQKAYEHYEDFQPGRGDVFLRNLDAALTHLRAFPKIAPIFRRSYRRLLVPRFPYGIFYTIESSRIIIAAVTYLRQDPDLSSDGLVADSRETTTSPRSSFLNLAPICVKSALICG